MSWTAIIPARANSKGLPNKNILSLRGKPLYMYAVDEAIAAEADKVVITTDIAQIISGAQKRGVEVLVRPRDLALDATSMESVILHACKTLNLSGTIVLLQPTSPLRRAKHIQMGLSMYAQGHFDLVMSVTEANSSVLKWGFFDGTVFRPISDPKYCFANRQQLPGLVRPNGAIYVFDAESFVDREGFPVASIGALRMTPEESLDVDTLEDFERCEAALEMSEKVR